MMREDDVQALRTAVATLEHPGWPAAFAEIAGKPIELFNRARPEPAEGDSAHNHPCTQYGP
jgi:hypothetical protein